VEDKGGGREKILRSMQASIKLPDHKEKYKKGIEIKWRLSATQDYVLRHFC
jgi:hypothetical protein